MSLLSASCCFGRERWTAQHQYCKCSFVHLVQAYTCMRLQNGASHDTMAMHGDAGSPPHPGSMPHKPCRYLPQADSTRISPPSASRQSMRFELVHTIATTRP